VQAAQKKELRRRPMGKGDARSKRGKIWRSSNGKTRPKGKKKKDNKAASE
jgi:30S ribosomal protein S31